MSPDAKDDFESIKTAEELKEALLERLVRLGATDVEDLPGIRNFISSTPRLFMRKRSPEELAALEKGVARSFRKVEAPLERKLHTMTAGWESPRAKRIVRGLGKMVIRNPEQLPIVLAPFPGASALTPPLIAAKRGVEKVIDKVAPAAPLPRAPLPMHSVLAKAAAAIREAQPRPGHATPSVTRESKLVTPSPEGIGIGGFAGEAMAKAAEVGTELKPHQRRVVERIQKQPGLVVAHGMGSGKTLSSIAAAEALGGPTTVLVPAALKSNYQKELEKHITGTPSAEYDVGSLQRAAVTGDIAPSKMLIVDEAHRLRDPSSKGRKAVRAAETEKRMLLTGTPLYNRPFDLASLVNVAAGDNVFPGAQSDFDQQYIGEKITQPGWWARHVRGVQPGSVPVLKNEKQLGQLLQQWVDFHENTSENFPARQDEVVSTTLSPKQQELYNFAMGDAPAWVKYKIQHGLPPSKAESKDINAFSGAVRQISNSPGGFAEGMGPEEAAGYSPKLQEAYRRLAENMAANPQHRAVVYSNFLESGLHPYEALLKQKNVPYGKFTGEVSKKDRDRMVKDYNEGRLKALLLSSAGGEGLDLKGTRQIQVLEPHWNKEKLEQVIARGIRYGSHAHLPEDQRKVLVEHYVSQMPEPGMVRKLFGAKRPGSIDEYLRMMSGEKDKLNLQVKELLKQTDQQKTSSLADEVGRYADIVSSLW